MTRFRWVACQMDHLCELPNDAARRKALNTLPPTLHATYERILLRVNKRSKEVQQLVQRSLRWLVCSKSPLSSSALCEAISISPGDTTLDRTAIPGEDEVLRWCSSLVRRSASGESLELAHFTVKEFLTTGIDSLDSEFGAYHFGLDIDDEELAEMCLTYLSFKEFADGGKTSKDSLHERMEKFAFRLYAVRNWMEHARKHLAKPVVWSLMQDLLHPSKPLVFISWAHDLLRVFDAPDDMVAYTEPRLVNRPDLVTESPLHFASLLALPELCEWLILKGCCINQSSEFGTPLECALLGDDALYGQDFLAISEEPPSADLGESRFATVKLLISSGADVHRSSLGRPSPMFIALSMADRLSCIELLRKGAPIDSDTAKELSKDYRYDIAREIWEGIDTTSLRPEDRAILLDAALHSEGFSSEGSDSVVGCRSQNQVSPHVDNLTPFLTAAEYGQLGVVEHIAQNPRFDINAARPETQRSALHLASSNDHIDIVKFLLEHGANCNLCDSQGRTPLHTSVEKRGRYRCLEFLLGPRADVNSGDKTGLTAWHLAASESNIHALSILKGFVADGQLPLHLKSNDGKTLLHCAAQSSSKDILVFLMEHCNQSAVYDTDSDGFTALHYAVKAKSLDAVQYLIDRKFDTHAITIDGSNTLHCAVDQDSEVVWGGVELLLKKGVDPCKIRKDGMTPIHLLLSRLPQIPETIYGLSQWETVLNGLTQYAMSLDSTYGVGLSLLHQVCQLGDDGFFEWRPTALKILLQNGADPTLQDDMGKTALMYLVEAGKKSIMKSGYVPTSTVKMIKETIDSTDDETFLSTVCADPQNLCLALVSRNEELAYKLLEYSPSVDATIDEISALSSLEAACQYGCSRKLLEELLGRSKVDRGAAGSASGLLVCACKAKRGPIDKTTVIDLLDLGFDPNDRPVEGRSALMLAAEVGDLAVVEILIHHGADVSATDNNGWSVIHYALLSRNEELWQYLRRFSPDWNATIAADLGSWSRDATALHIAASCDSRALEFLLKTISYRTSIT